MRNFREYDVWIDAMELVNDVYDNCDKFPKNEQYGITSQITRSAVSIPSNIAEGASRKSEKDFTRFLEYSLGSAFELETQLRIVQRRNYISQVEAERILVNLVSLQKRISGFRKSILKNEK